MSTQNRGSSGHALGGMLLIAGCCIGAGMLGLPVLSAAAGFIPSLVFFVLSWLFMAATGLLLLEVNLWFDTEVNLISMVKKTLGNSGAGLCWFLFLFLFYSLVVAYISASGSLFSSYLLDLAGIELTPWVGGLIFTMVFGLLTYIGTQAVDIFNRLLMVGLIVSYIILVVMGIPHVQPKLLLHQNWGASILVIPAMIISFGYHNLIPSLKVYLNGDICKLRWTILLGSSIPLIIYLAWQLVILGIVPQGHFQSALDNGETAASALKTAVGSSWVLSATQHFAFFAIATSFIAVVLSLVDFLADGLKIKKTYGGRAFLCSLTLIPPFVLAYSYPGLFFMALNYAGAFGAVILFGILPALMVWKGRYIQKQKGFPERVQVLPGGKAMLILIIVSAIGIVGLQLALELGLLTVG